MPEPDLSFIAEQLRRLLDEMADMRAGLADVKDDMSVLTAIVLRLEGRMTRHDERLDRFEHRLRRVEEARAQ